MEAQTERSQSLNTRPNDVALLRDIHSLLNLLPEDRQILRSQSLITRLYVAALEGNVPCLLNLLQEDPLILDRCNIEKPSHFMQSPLHVAVKQGHLDFTKEILCRKLELAEELDQSKGSSSLHMASTKGHWEIVKALLEVNPDMCLIHDQDGRNPAHVAAIKGRIDVIQELHLAKPQATWERTDGGETVLHLCVKHGQQDALKLLLNLTDDAALLNSKDRDGNTVLHLAVATRQPKMVEFLLTHGKIAKNATNTNGWTAMDTHLKSRKDLISEKEIMDSLKRAKAKRAKDVQGTQNGQSSWLEKQSSALMIVASLIATMAFQVGINPPGGTWQDDKDGHKAGHPIMASQVSKGYDLLMIFDEIALTSSLSVILLLISGLPCRRLFLGILMITMWIAVTATTLTFSAAVFHESRSNNDYTPFRTTLICIFVWLILVAALVLAHVIRFIVKLIRKLVRLWRKKRSTRPTTYPPI